MTQHAAERNWLVEHGTDLPPPRPGVRHLRVVRLGIVIADDPLRRRVDQFFHWPMIIMALLVLPLLGVELIWHPATWSWLWWVCTIALVIIWLAFLVEFVVKIAVAECRLEYVKRNWFDVVILCLPALRPLRVAYVARTTRLYTLRGVGMKFARYVITALVGLEMTERMLRRFGLKKHDGRCDPEQMTRHELHKEVRRLRQQVDAWEAWHEAMQSHVSRNGEALPDSPPLLNDGETTEDTEEDRELKPQMNADERG